MIQSLSANEVEALESRIIGTLRKFLLKSLSVRHKLPLFFLLEFNVF